MASAYMVLYVLHVRIRQWATQTMVQPLPRLRQIPRRQENNNFEFENKPGMRENLGGRRSEITLVIK